MVNRESDIAFDYPDDMSVGEKIKRLRLGKPGLTQTKLVEVVRKLGGDLSQSQLSAIERGESPRPRALHELAEALGTTYEELIADDAPRTSAPPSTPDNVDVQKVREAIAADPSILKKFLEGQEAALHNVHSFFFPKRGARKGLNNAQRRLPVWSSAEGGRGAWIVNDSPISWVERPDFLEHVVGAFAVRLIGDSASPKYEHDDVLLIDPSRQVKAGDWCLFLKEIGEPTETFAAVKRLVRSTAGHWLVSQLTPAKQFELPKAEWRKAYKVVGAYTDR